jgi:hypothetical protein
VAITTETLWERIRPQTSGLFEVRSYYKVLSSPNVSAFPWKSIWKSKSPPRVAFFVGTAAHGRLLTMDNLRNRHICIVDWCCMCKSSGESTDHFLLHCDVAQGLWSMMFCLFGLHWVIPARVVDLLACWMGVLWKSRQAALWGMIPSCIMRLL